MDWQKLVTDIILAVVGAAATGLFTMLMKWVNTKIKDEKIKKLITGALDIVSNGVDYVYQIYVEGLKGTDVWDAEAMQKANSMAVEYIKTRLTQEALDSI